MAIRIPEHARQEAVTHYLETWDLEGTGEWFLERNADDPVVKRASNPKKLARNIITMGGDEAERIINRMVHQNAVGAFVSRANAQELAQFQQRITRLEEENERERERTSMANATVSKTRDRVDEAVNAYANVKDDNTRLMLENAEMKAERGAAVAV